MYKTTTKTKFYKDENKIDFHDGRLPSQKLIQLTEAIKAV